ncbi:MAG TPA: trypsin-like peptidase domain-containing protein [Gemmataceae bacterium]|jgi:S1-C subfamily serine protease|nr:trypsin-like peptidase domain-containing protein [Gemmataceae bacterium]
MNSPSAPRVRKTALCLLGGSVVAAVVMTLSAQAQRADKHAAEAAAQDVDKRVVHAEAQRIAVIKKVKPAVVAVFDAGGQGGGSGVLISKEGYALTNFHVVEGAGALMQCGLPDGIMYDGVLVGLDKVGDVALIKLLPKKEGQEFPFAPLGDSDKVQAGDWSLAMGNPFLLATDFNPTVTFGLVSGVHRYQYPAGTLLEYTDCIQIDTSINPGNSGGPLFNMDGELIGINGRGSFEKRGRVNSGVGYAISINQIKNFLGHLMAGLEADHATLGATVESDKEGGEGSSSRMVVSDILEDSDAYRRGLQPDAELVAFAGRPMTSVNQYKNVLGLFPKGWRVPLVYREKNQKHEILVRLMQLQRTPQQEEEEGKPKPKPAPPRPRPPVRNKAAGKMYEPRPGFANYYFNKLQRQQLIDNFHKHGDFSTAAGDWTLDVAAELNTKKSDARVVIREEADDKNGDGKPAVNSGTYHLRVETLPKLPDADPKADKDPFRQMVRSADALLRKHATSFPQEVWAQTSEELLKNQVIEMQKDVAIIRTSLTETLEDLQAAAKDRDKETSRTWRAQYDYTVAKLQAFLSYVDEYNYMLGQLRKDPPKRDPKIHRGWKMVAQDKQQSGGEAHKLADAARKGWNKMAKAYAGSIWEQLAKREGRTPLGLHWEATGGTKTIVHLDLGTSADGKEVKYVLDPLKLDQKVDVLKEPAGSGGLMVALYQYRRLLTLGTGGFEQYATHGGHEPFYPPAADGVPVSTFKQLRVDTEVLLTEHAAVPAKWYFSLKDHTLLGFEVRISEEDDPCEVYLSDYRMEDGRQLPHHIEVRYGNKQYGVFTVKGKFQVAAAK